MKKKRKIRKFRVFLLIVILIIIGFLIKLLIKNINNKKELKGEKIDNYIYHYVIPNEVDKYKPTKVINNNIYYLEEKDREYTLYKRNIYSDKDIKIGDIEGENDYCDFYDNHIFCSRKDEYYYDYNLKLLYKKEYNEEEYSQIIPYKNKYLILKEDELYDNDKLMKKLDMDGYYYSGIFTTKTNTILTFYSRYINNYKYYDIENDKYTESDNNLWSFYNEGYYGITEDELSIYNIVKDEKKQYKNNIFDNFSTTNYLYNNMYYFIDNNKLYEMDLENNKISIINYEIGKEITRITYDNGYLYLMGFSDDYDIYLIDINKVNKTTYTLEEFNKYISDLIDKKVLELEEKYHVNLVYKDEVKIDNSTFEAKTEKNDFKVLNSLDNMERVLSKFNVEFFDKFRDDTHEGMIFYLAGHLIPHSGVDTTSNPVGYTLSENNQYEMVIDIDNRNLEGTICHEMMHNMENRIGDFPYEWYDKNPKNFSYEYSYTKTPNDKYTIYEDDNDNVYFVDSYSKTYPTEDLARTFENVCSYDENSRLLLFPHLYDKAIFLKEWLIENYPSLKESNVFNSLNKKE